MNQKNESSLCKGGTTLLFSCSGAADVGALTDLAARRMTKEGIGKMFCLAGIGGGVSGIVETTKSAENLLAIDGCPIACVKKMLERNGFNNFSYLELSSIGFEKGKSPTTDEAVRNIVKKGAEILAG